MHDYALKISASLLFVLILPSVGAMATTVSDSARPSVKPHLGLLYVAEGSDVAIFRQDLGRRIGDIPFSSGSPRNMAVDSAGTLYVADPNGGYVSIYPAGRRTPSLILAYGLSEPIGVAVDSIGTVYVSDGETGLIVEYPAGQQIPSAIIPPYVAPGSGGGLLFAEDIAVDAARNIFVCGFFGVGYTQDVLEYPAGPAPSWRRFNLNPYFRNALTSLTVDRLGRLVVAEEVQNPPGGIFVYNVARGTVVRSIGTRNGARNVRFNHDRSTLFASDSLGRWVDAFDYVSGKLIRRIDTRSRVINGIAVGPS